MMEGQGKSGRERRLTAIDLFAGAGGVTEGLKAAGYSVVGAIEIDKDAARSYSLNHPSIRLQITDIRDVDAEAERIALNLKKGDLTLLKACPPCQGFSTLGREDKLDPRNDLILEIWRFVRAFFPEAVVLENVPKIRSDLRLRRVVRQMRAIGYHVRGFDVDAASFGVPQHRRRHIVIGIRGDSATARFATMESFLGIREEVFAGPVLERVEKHVRSDDPLNRWRSSSDIVMERIASIPVGGNRFDLPPDLVLDCHSRLKNRNATSAYGRIRYNQPAPTMTTRCTTPSCGSFIHPTRDRGLSLREAASLQTFPMSYRFSGGYDSIERQIGNAVPVALASAIGETVRALVIG